MFQAIQTKYLGPTVQSLASDLYDAMVLKTRANGESFTSLKDGSPDWMQDVVRKAHGDFLPDDWRFAAIKHLASAVSEMDDADDADGYGEICDGAVSVYTGALTAWLASNIIRVGYCDQAHEELGAAANMSQALMQGQYFEYYETLTLLVSALQEHAADEGEA